MNNEANNLNRSETMTKTMIVEFTCYTRFSGNRHQFVERFNSERAMNARISNLESRCATINYVVLGWE